MSTHASAADVEDARTALAARQARIAELETLLRVEQLAAQLDETALLVLRVDLADAARARYVARPPLAELLAQREARVAAAGAAGASEPLAGMPAWSHAEPE